MSGEEADNLLEADKKSCQEQFDGGWGGFAPETWQLFEIAWRLGYQRARSTDDRKPCAGDVNAGR